MYHKDESLPFQQRRWRRRPCKHSCCNAEVRGCSSQNGQLLSAAFCLSFRPSYCSQTSVSVMKNQWIISNSLFSSGDGGGGSNFLSCQGSVNYKRVRGREAGLHGSPRGFATAGWCYRGPSPVPWDRILACQSKWTLMMLSLPRAGRGAWRLGTCEASS